MTTTFSTPIEFPDGTEEVIEFTCEWSKGGIGWYEYWGAKCYDAGRWDLDNVSYDESKLTKEQCQHIEKILDSRGFEDKAWDSLGDN